MNLQHVVHIINVTKAIRRIPSDLKRPGLTYFSINDTWVYHAVFDEVFCPICQDKAVPFTYAGSSLRREFPYLEIVGENRIYAHAHMPRDDNCRCWLMRVTDEPPSGEEARYQARLEHVKDSSAKILEAVRRFERERRKVRIEAE